MKGRLRSRLREIREADQLFSPKRRLRRSIYLLPSVFTVGNLFAGFLALISCLSEQYGFAAVAIGVAVVLDGLDGRVARLANVTSDFGLQLDSLADAISFGVAPAILVYSWGFADLGKFARFSAFVFLICGVMRLARFNLQSSGLRQFVGLPIPAGAGFIAANVHFFQQPGNDPLFQTYLVAATYLTAFLMISTIRYPSLKHLNLRRGKSHFMVLFLALLMAGVFYYSQEVLLALASGYLASGPVMRFYHLARRRGGEQPSTKPLETE